MAAVGAAPGPRDTREAAAETASSGQVQRPAQQQEEEEEQQHQREQMQGPFLQDAVNSNGGKTAAQQTQQAVASRGGHTAAPLAQQTVNSKGGGTAQQQQEQQQMQEAVPSEGGAVIPVQETVDNEGGTIAEAALARRTAAEVALARRTLEADVDGIPGVARQATKRKRSGQPRAPRQHHWVPGPEPRRRSSLSE